VVDLSGQGKRSERQGRFRLLGYLLGAVALLALVVALTVGLARDFVGDTLVREVIVLPLDGGMDLVLFRIGEREIEEADLYLEDGTSVGSATLLPGRRGALVFFVPTNAQWTRLEVVTPAGTLEVEK